MSKNTDLTKREASMPERSSHIASVTPLVDIYENNDEILLHADMPGVGKEDISLNIDNGKLMIRGVRTFKTSGAASWEEFGDVAYERTFSVPQTIDIGKVNAELKDGVLRLHLPKSEAAKPRQIVIN